jgi:hypothetical protein
MGDKNPKSVQKKSTQKQVKTATKGENAAKTLAINQAARPKK